MITINPQAADVITIQLSDADQIQLNTAAILLEDRDVDTLDGEDGTFYLSRANHTGTQAANTITGLAAVATSGSYNDLSNKPTISTDAETLDGQDGAYYLSRTNHSGTQAISTVTGLQAALDDKLESVAWGEITGTLSDQTDLQDALDTLTDTDIDLQDALDLKLDAADYNDRFLGLFASVFDLEAAHPTASAGDYAQVDWGIGVDVIVYAWDVSDAYWAAIGVSTISTTDDVPEGSSNLYFTSQRVRDTTIGALPSVSAVPIVPTDNLPTVAAKLQARATDNAALLPPPFDPGWYRTGLRYDAAYPYYTPTIVTTTPVGVVRFCQRKILNNVTFSELSVNVTTAAASSTVFYGVYASDASGLPSTLLASGSASGETTGAKSTAVTLALTKGQVVWDAYLNTGAVVSVTAIQLIFQGGANSPTADGAATLTKPSQTSLTADASVGEALVRSATSRIPRIMLRAV